MKEIKKIVVEGVGAIFQSDGDIVCKQIGEQDFMFHQQATNRVFTGRYVIEVEYFPEIKPSNQA